MPGVSLHSGSSDTAIASGERLEALLHDERYEKSIVVEEESYTLAYTGYTTYPVEIVRVGEYLIAFEGYIYDWDHSDLRSELSTLVYDRFGGFENTEAISEWIQAVDGEFVLVAINESTEDATVIGDCLGRLPLYYATVGTDVVISREQRFVVDYLTDAGAGNPIEADGGVVPENPDEHRSQRLSVENVSPAAREIGFDRMAVAQFLLFGHTLGDRTLVEGVKSLPPAPFVRITDEGLAVERLHEFDFQECTHRDKTREQNASELASMFNRACRTRAKIGEGGSVQPSSPPTPNLISLSGGLDSRAVLASFAEQELPCFAATMNYAGVMDSDIDTAAELTRQYGIDWEYYDLAPPDAGTLRKHIRLKDARDPLMPYLLVFFEELLSKHTSVTCIIGAGGDMVLPDLTPARSIADLDELVEYLVSSSHRYSIEDVAALSGVEAEEIRRSIRERFEQYPETDPEQLYVHFRIYERARNWLFEAEDTNRCYFWSVTPFYSLPFFRYAMNCPNEQKRWYRLYTAFLSQLSEKAIGPANANFAVSPESPFHTLAAFSFETLQRYPGVLETIKPAIKSSLGVDIKTDTEGPPLTCIRRQLDESPAISGILSEPALRHRVLDSTEGEGPSRREVYLLLTLTSYIDELTSRRSVLEINSSMTFE
jgi:asparagine synthase (glutamine-hydrolysing)